MVGGVFRVRHLPFRDETFASRAQFGDGDFCLFEDFQTETFADIQIETFAETFFLEHMKWILRIGSRKHQNLKK